MKKESDLISRGAALQALKKAKELASKPQTRFDIYINKIFDLCIRLIAAFDAVDAAPVVRCKDCCYLAKDGESLYCTYPCSSDVLGRIAKFVEEMMNDEFE